MSDLHDRRWREMKRDEAEQCWQMISTVYGLHPERVRDQAPTWVDALVDMDCDTVVGIVAGWMRGSGPERLPTIVAFAADVYAIQRRNNRPVTPPEPKTSREKSLWVYAWEIIVREWEGPKGMHPLLPEQKPGYESCGYGFPCDGRRVIKSGSPEYVNVMELARAAKVAS